MNEDRLIDAYVQGKLFDPLAWVRFTDTSGVAIVATNFTLRRKKFGRMVVVSIVTSCLKAGKFFSNVFAKPVDTGRKILKIANFLCIFNENMV